jgi:D-alanyl-D-alanine carboxypeptidase-like protein
MAGNRSPGPACQVKNWFADPIDPGTSFRGSTPKPGPTEDTGFLSRLQVGLWQPPLRFAPLGRAQGDFAEFEQRVLDTHILRAALRHHGRPAAPEIPESELLAVDGDHKLRKDAARKYTTLIEKARIDLKAAKANGSANADTKFGITSAYRGPKYDEGLWRDYFQTKYYRLRLSKLGRHFFVGPKSLDKIVQTAAQDLVRFIVEKKAAPGYSNHTKGIAVDFWTLEGGKMHKADTGKGEAAFRHLNQEWESTWLYKWLDQPEHKAEFGISRIPSEAWHWEFLK